MKQPMMALEPVDASEKIVSFTLDQDLMMDLSWEKCAGNILKLDERT
jgi:hypothetical protein